MQAEGHVHTQKKFHEEKNARKIKKYSRQNKVEAWKEKTNSQDNHSKKKMTARLEIRRQ